MKKLCFTLIIILACLVACNSPDELKNENYSDNDASAAPPDVNLVTVYLDDVPAGRAINREIAVMGCDYFEVTFLSRSSAGVDTVIRGEWMAGKLAGVSDIPRGVDYGGVTNAPANGSGSAILFAGKTDKTLMAIGRLYSVDGTEGSFITPTSKYVTFKLAAVTAAAAELSGTPPAALTVTPLSFLTAARDNGGNYQDISVPNTNVYADNIFSTVPDKFFPFYRLEKGRAVKAAYTFTLSSTESKYSFGAYSSGIFVAPAAFGAPIPGLPLSVDYKIERKQPRYTSPNGKFHQSILMLDEKTKVYLNNNNTAGLPGTPAPFDPVVQFTLDTTDPAVVNGSVFSLVFSIPVYALSETDQNGNKSRWYIRSSYGASLYDLDDGTRGMGGAILLGVGDVEISGDIEIYVKNTPILWKYMKVPPPPPDVRDFDIDGLEVWLRYRNTNQDIRKLEYNELDFIIGAKYVSPKWSPAYCSVPPDSPTYRFPNDFYGCLEIKVEYIHMLTGIVYKTSFFLLLSNTTYDFSQISSANTVHIFTDATNTASDKFRTLIQDVDPGTIIVLLYESFNMENIAANVPATGVPPARLYFFLAVRENIIIGRGRKGTAAPIYEGNQIYHWMPNAGLNAYYFGVWPYRDASTYLGNYQSGPGTGNPITRTYPFTVNSGGTVASAQTDPVNGGPNYPYSNIMIVDGQSPNTSSIYNVKVGPGVTIIPTVTTTDPITSEVTKSYPLLH